jgi:hypothetical protein
MTQWRLRSCTIWSVVSLEIVICGAEERHSATPMFGSCAALMPCYRDSTPSCAHDWLLCE